MKFIKDDYFRTYGSGDSWRVEIDLPARQPRTYFEESIEVAEFTYESKTGHLYLMYSGGLDSQYLYCLFLRLGFDFTPVIIELIGPDGMVYNHHDIKYAIEYCEATNKKPLIYKLDFDNFVESGKIVEIAEFAECRGYTLPATMFVSGQLDGFVVSASFEPHLVFRHGWFLEETQFIHSVIRYFRKKDIKGCPFFLSYSSEMFFSFLLDPTIRRLANNELVGKLSSTSSKSHVYNNGSNFNLPVYDFVSKTRVKFTGYEIINESLISLHPNMKIFEEYKKKWGGVHLLEYNSLIKDLI